MKATFVSLALSTLAAVGGAIAGPSPLPMGVEVFERDGVTHVREVPHEALQLDKRCRECKNVGERCTIGDGSCKADQHASCTWCGNHCKSICVPDGVSCESLCL
ncbi:hypothetical protein AAE478_009985 [Parahypoxylon ruwenzoriense]